MQFLWSSSIITEVKHFKTCKCCTFGLPYIIFFYFRSLETCMEIAVFIIVNNSTVQLGMYFVSNTFYWKISVTIVPKM